MMSATSYKLILLALFSLCVLSKLTAQTDEQKALEAKRARLQEEINQINSLLSQELLEKRSVSDQVEDLEHKIFMRRSLIKATNQQANILNKKLNKNLLKITNLRTELEVLKEDYAEMIRKSYKSKSQQSKLMFMLSSESFFQAYKRLQYMKQYTSFRKKQGEQIITKTQELQDLNKTLIQQRQEKEKLASENREEQKKLLEERNMQRSLLTSIRRNERNYKSQINKKTKEAAALDREIDKLIRATIAESNRRSGNNRNTTSFVLTPENKIIADNFESNKGNLIWPIAKGVKRRGFGEYADPVYPGVKHFNNGVILATQQGAKARAVFDGEVSAIIAVPGGNRAVQIRHGNYITTYYNLSRIYVKKGDQVKLKDELGEIFTSKSSGKTELKFFLYKDTNRLNPEDWVFRL